MSIRTAWPGSTTAVDARELPLQPLGHRLRRLARLDGDADRRDLVRSLGERWTTVSGRTPPRSTNAVARVVDAGDPERRACRRGAGRRGRGGVPSPPRRRASPRLRPARRPSMTTFRSVGELARLEAEEQELVLALDLADADEDLRRVGDARVGLHLREQALGEAPSASGRRRPAGRARSRSGRRGSGRWPSSCTPAVIESSATISPTPIATPATVSAVRTFRRRRFLQHEPRPGHGANPLIG